MKIVKLIFISIVIIIFNIIGYNNNPISSNSKVQHVGLSFTSSAFAKSNHFLNQQFETSKTYCMQMTKNVDINEIKKQLLIHAKQSAASELYGDLIYAEDHVKRGLLYDNEIIRINIGFIKISGNPIYYNGHNFGETCVKINAYITEEDKKDIVQKFKMYQKTQDKTAKNFIKNNIKCVEGFGSISAQCRKNPCPQSQKVINAEQAAIVNAERKCLSSHHETKIKDENGEIHTISELYKMGKISGRVYDTKIEGDFVKVKYCLELVEDFYKP